MAKDKLEDYDTTEGLNTDLGGTSIQGTNNASVFDNMLRRLMAHLKTYIGSVTTTEVGYLSGVTSAIQTQLGLKAPLADPALTGNPTTPTQSAGDNSTKIASTAYVRNEILNKNYASTHDATAVLHAASTDRELTSLSTAITTSKANAKVLIQAVITFDSHWNGMFYIERNGTEVGSHATAGSRLVGFVPSAFDNELQSTLAQAKILFIDDVVTAGVTTYTFHYRSSGSTAFALNRTLTDTDSSVYERGASFVLVEEYA